jgi:hypothetical protein
MSVRELSWVLLGAALLICLGMLLGATWTTQALRVKFRQHAEERRRLNDEWLALRTARLQRRRCPHCAGPLSTQDWYLTPTVIQQPLDDD